MRIDGKSYRTIWTDETKLPLAVYVIDQRLLPFQIQVNKLSTLSEVCDAISHMQVRGAPLIGVAAAYGVYLAALARTKSNEVVTANSLSEFSQSLVPLLESRPTAINLKWGVDQQLSHAARFVGGTFTWSDIAGALAGNAARMADADVARCQAIGTHGLKLLQELAQRKNGKVLNILTHCNAGWLCAIDMGTATAPIYLAQRAGIPIHVWVDETRPRLQGSKLTAFELSQEGIPHSIVVDNAGGHLMQTGQVDICIVGTDRTARNGDVANKIGTYLKALAAFDNGIPFFVALPESSIDWQLGRGVDIPIEERSQSEVLFCEGSANKHQYSVQIANPSSPASNPGFDITPARLVTGLITERGVCKASEGDLLKLYPDRVKA